MDGGAQYITPSFEPDGAKPNDADWWNEQGTAVFSLTNYLDGKGSCVIRPRSPGIGEAHVRIDDDPNLTAYTIIDKLKNGDYIEKGTADKLLDYDNAVILFMSSKEIYILENEYEELLKKKLNIE